MDAEKESLSYKSLVLFMLDMYYTTGVKSVTVGNEWNIDWDAIRAAGFDVTEQDDQCVVSWDDDAVLALEAAKIGYKLTAPEVT